MLLAHGSADRMVPSSHSAWLAGQLPSADLSIISDEGHITVTRHAAETLRWLQARH
ncbi:hypothetical protein ACPPVO_21635 [Dactylosporangium sp. McL0621]|uniref:hypothetical protein n=1 Tax=Dactylosporangium sp. McL0621 TaxID=3415678 RepID=UPI003CED9255